MSDPRPSHVPPIVMPALIALAFVVAGFILERLDVFPALRFAIQRPGPVVSNQPTVPDEEVARGLPVVAVQIDPEHLYGEETGLLTHVEGRGREWERPATLTYYDEGRVVFASGVGLRVHGGITRVLSTRKSFRFYFRRQYGAAQFRPGVLFDRRTDPLRDLILHSDIRADAYGRDWHFINPLALDITEAVGAIAPQTQPVGFFLNGEWQGVHVLTERFRDTNDMPLDSLIARFGHANFAADSRSFDHLYNQIAAFRPIRMSDVEPLIDLDNLTRWFIAILFCATEDVFQGPQLQDLSDQNGRWFFINWDMDHSFMDYNEQSLVPWEHDTFRTTLERAGEARRGRRRSEIRSIVLTTLLAEDQRYRDYFKRTFDEVMNHRLTPEFLDERFAYYEEFGRAWGESREYLTTLRDYLTHRPAVLRAHAEQYTNTLPSLAVVVVADSPGRLVIDGQPVGSAFEGLYFPGTTLVIAVTDASRETFSHWVVDGAPMSDRTPRIEVRVDRNLIVEPVWMTRSTSS